MYGADVNEVIFVHGRQVASWIVTQWLRRPSDLPSRACWFDLLSFNDFEQVVHTHVSLSQGSEKSQWPVICYWIESDNTQTTIQEYTEAGVHAYVENNVLQLICGLWARQMRLLSSNKPKYSSDPIRIRSCRIQDFSYRYSF